MIQSAAPSSAGTVPAAWTLWCMKTFVLCSMRRRICSESITLYGNAAEIPVSVGVLEIPPGKLSKRGHSNGIYDQHLIKEGRFLDG